MEKRERGGLDSPLWRAFGRGRFVNLTGRGRAFEAEFGAEAEEVDGEGDADGWERFLGDAEPLFRVVSGVESW